MHQFDWDASGDTVIEKCTALWSLMNRILDDDLSAKRGVVVAHSDVVTIFEVAHHDFIFPPTLITIQNGKIEMEYSGRMRNDPKYLDVYRDLSFPLDRMIMLTLRGDKHSIVELKNIQ